MSIIPLPCNQNVSVAAKVQAGNFNATVDEDVVVGTASEIEHRDVAKVGKDVCPVVAPEIQILNGPDSRQQHFCIAVEAKHGFHRSVVDEDVVIGSTTEDQVSDRSGICEGVDAIISTKIQGADYATDILQDVTVSSTAKRQICDYACVDQFVYTIVTTEIQSANVRASDHQGVVVSSARQPSSCSFATHVKHVFAVASQDCGVACGGQFVAKRASDQFAK